MIRLSSILTVQGLPSALGRSGNCSLPVNDASSTEANLACVKRDLKGFKCMTVSLDVLRDFLCGNTV